ncbi:MAG: hypothetical protein ABI758_04300 [Candidatus Woesebacteria bacterium]
MFKQSTTLHIHVSNVSEDVWDFIQTISDKKARQFEIDENAELSDRDIFSFAKHDDVVLILPKQLNTDFFSYFQKLFSKKNFNVIVPSQHSGEISLDIAADNESFEVLVQKMKQYEHVQLTSYSASAEFYVLLESLQKFHTSIQTPESPKKKDAWSVDFFGSKTGIRQLADHAGTPNFRTVEGYSTFGVDLAAHIASDLYDKEGAAVIKTNKGHAGAGVVLMRSGELKSNDHVREIKQRLADSYWEKFPILIEQFVECDPRIGGGFPNSEFLVHKNGTVEFLYFCGMRVTKEGTFKGVEIGESSLSKSVAKQIITAGYAIGEGLALYGYAGYYDVDCLASKSGKVYISESNVRRTGGTHVYHTALAMFGSEWMKETYALSNNSYTIASSKEFTFTTLYETLTPVLYNKDSTEGVVIVAANPLHRNVFGYIIFGKNKKRAYAIETRMEKLLGQ